MQPCITGAADRLLTGNARMSDFENAIHSHSLSKIPRFLVISVFAPNVDIRHFPTFHFLFRHTGLPIACKIILPWEKSTIISIILVQNERKPSSMALICYGFIVNSHIYCLLSIVMSQELEKPPSFYMLHAAKHSWQWADRSHFTIFSVLSWACCF